MWKLLSHDHYYQFEVELVTLVCRGQGIRIQNTITNLPYLSEDLPLLTVGSSTYSSKQIVKFLSNAFIRNNHDFEIFDTCYKLITVIEYFMWRDPNIYYDYRDKYTLDPVNKLYQILYLHKKNKQIKQEIDTQYQATLKAQELLDKLSILKTDQLSFNSLLIYCILKYLVNNVRGSRLFKIYLNKSDLVAYVNGLEHKLSQPFEIEDCNWLIEIPEIEPERRDHRINWIQTLIKGSAFGLITYAMFN